MAEASKVRLEADMVKEKLFCCSICMERYNCPKILPCLHTFCESCLDGYIKKTSKSAKFCSPCCRMTTQIPSNGAVDFNTNFFMNSLLAFFWDEDVELSCTVCTIHGKTSTAVSKCLDCSDCLCAACSKVHHQTWFTAKHSVIPMGIASQVKPTSITDSKSVTSAQHPWQKVTFYCTKCDQTLCKDCKYSTHHSHKCVTVQETIRERKCVLLDMIQHLSEECRDSQSKEIEVEEFQKDIKHEHNLFTKKLGNIYQTMVDSLTKFKTEAVAETKRQTEKILQQNETDFQETRYRSSHLKICKRYMETSLDSSTDTEILDTFRMLKQHYVDICEDRTKTEYHHNVTLSQYRSANGIKIKQFFPTCQRSVDEAGNLVNAKAYQQPIIDTASVETLPDPVFEKVCVALALSDGGDIFACCEYKVYNYDQDWKDINIASVLPLPRGRALDITVNGTTLIVATEALLEYPGGDTPISFIVLYDITKQTSEVNDVQFCSDLFICLGLDNSTPYLAISDNGTEVLEITNTWKKGQKSWKADNFSFARYITQCENGNIFVSDRFCIHMLNRKLEPVTCLEEPIFAKPRAIRSDRAGNVYVASKGTDSVVIMSSEGLSPRCILGHEDRIESPISLAVSHEKLAVGHKGGVWIYTFDNSS